MFVCFKRGHVCSHCGGGDMAAKSCPTLATPWTVACQTPLSTGFPRQEYWSGLSFPSAGDLPDPEMEPVSLALEGRFFTTDPPCKHVCKSLIKINKSILREFIDYVEFVGKSSMYFIISCKLCSLWLLYWWKLLINIHTYTDFFLDTWLVTIY